MKAYEAVRNRLSMQTRRRIAEKRVRLRTYSARLRVMPDFLIIGAQRSGTSSLYRYLGDHPEIVASLRKETQYFTRRFAEGVAWYKAHFPLAQRMWIQGRLKARQMQTFEATPDYLFHTLAPTRVQEALPDAKLIVLLRDPVERSYSHYKHMRSLGLEPLEFVDALDAEYSRVTPDLEQLAHNPFHPCISAMRFSYMSRGHYAEQLERWFVRFDRSQFLILDAEELFNDERGTLTRICNFLGVSDWAPSQFRNFSRPTMTDGSDDGLDDAVRERLIELYKPESERLNEVTGREFSWTTGPDPEPAHRLPSADS